MSGNLNLGDLSFNVTAATTGLQAAVDALNDFSNKVNATASAQVTATQKVKKSIDDVNTSLATTKAANSNFATALKDIQSSAILATGPLGGISSRIAAFAAISERSNVSLAAFSAAVAGTIVGIIALTHAAIEVVEQLEKINSVMVAGSGSQAAATDNFQHVHDTALALGQPLLTLADAYAKLSVATQDTSLAGAKTRQVFDDTVAALSGIHASTEQATNVFAAFSQMADRGSVTTRQLVGQLNSTFPGALQITAAALGMTTTQMKSMMTSGTLMTSQVLPALAKGLKDTFGSADSGDTLSASLNNLKTSWTDFLEAFDKSTSNSADFKSIVDSLANSLEFLSKNMDSLLTIVGTLSGALIGMGIYSILGTIIPAITAFVAICATATTALAAMEITLAALAGPIGLIALAITGAAAGFYIFRKGQTDVIQSNTDLLKSLKDVQDQANKNIPVNASLADSMGKQVTDNVNMLSSKIVDLRQRLLDLGNLPIQFPPTKKEIADDLVLIAQYQAAIKALKDQQASTNKAVAGITPPTDNTGPSKAVTDAMEKIKALQDQIGEFAKNSNAPDAILQITSKVDGFRNGLDKANVSQALANQLTDQYAAALKTVDLDKAMRDLNQKTQASVDVTNSILNGVSPEAAKQQQAIDQQIALAKALADTPEAANAAADAIKNYYSAVTRQDQVTKQFTEAVHQIDGVMDDMAGGITDAITSTKSLSQAFSDMVQSILQSLTKMLIQMSITEPLGNAIKSMLGLASGTAAGNSGGLFGWIAGKFDGFADGGSVSGNVPIIVGEQGPEVFVPGNNGYIVPNSATSMSTKGSSDSGTTNQFNIGVTVSGPAGSDPDSAKKAGMIISQQIKGAIADYITQQQRPGGQLYGRR